jgi:hypothetical protein
MISKIKNQQSRKTKIILTENKINTTIDNSNYMSISK